MINFSLKLKNINLKLKYIKNYKKKKLFLIMKQSKISKITLKNFSKNFFFFLILIPKHFYFKIKNEFILKLKEIKKLTTIQSLSFKKGFNNNILQYYLKTNIYKFLKNKNKLIILYQLNLTSNNYINFFKNYFTYLNQNFYFLYNIYNQITFSNNNYNYLLINYFQQNQFQINKDFFEKKIFINTKIFIYYIKYFLFIYYNYIANIIKLYNIFINFFFFYYATKKINFL